MQARWKADCRKQHIFAEARWIKGRLELEELEETGGRTQSFLDPSSASVFSIFKEPCSFFTSASV